MENKIFLRSFSSVAASLLLFGDPVSEEEAVTGYYVFDLRTKRATPLKRFKPSRGEGLSFGAYVG